MIRSRVRLAAVALALAVALLGGPAAAYREVTPERAGPSVVRSAVVERAFVWLKALWSAVAASEEAEAADEPEDVEPSPPTTPQPQGDAGGAIDPDG